MTNPDWAALAAALRSYMADVTGKKHFDPVHDPLHYALIRGNDGVRRWHLVHPEALPHLQTLDHTLHDRLGGKVEDGGDLYSVDVKMRANRVPMVLGEHPEFGPVIIKGGEHHTELRNPADQSSQSPRTLLPTQRDSTPPRSLRWSEKPDHRPSQGGSKFEGNGLLNLHTDLQPYEGRIREDMGMLPLTPYSGNFHSSHNFYRPLTHTRTEKTEITPVSQQLEQADEQEANDQRVADFGHHAEWTTGCGIAAGAPMVPLSVGRIGAAAPEANGVAGQDFWLHPDQYADFQPYIHNPEDAAAALGVQRVYRDELPPHIDNWRWRLDGRLKTTEHITGAPDCHSGNYIPVPLLLPDGKIADVKHGIDYAWMSQHGMLHDDYSNFINLASGGLPANEYELGENDVFASMKDFPDHPVDGYVDSAKEEAVDAWEHPYPLGIEALNERREHHDRLAEDGQVRP